MAETDAIYEFGREPGFSSLVYSPDSSYILQNKFKQEGLVKKALS